MHASALTLQILVRGSAVAGLSQHCDFIYVLVQGEMAQDLLDCPAWTVVASLHLVLQTLAMV